MTRDVSVTFRTRAFRRGPTRTYTFLVSGDVVRVWDPHAGYYTSNHDVREPMLAQIKRLAAKQGQSVQPLGSHVNKLSSAKECTYSLPLRICALLRTHGVYMDFKELAVHHARAAERLDVLNISDLALMAEAGFSDAEIQQYQSAYDAEITRRVEALNQQH